MPKAKSSLSELFAGLKSLAAHGGERVGDTYARAARSLLDEVERIEDANAERRYRQRLRNAPPLRLPPPKRSAG